MSLEAIAEIKEAEARAAVLCRVTEERAADILAGVKREGSEHLAEVKRVTEAEYAEKLRDVVEKAEQLVTKKKKDAEIETEFLRAAASARMQTAVDMIVWRIVEKCL